MKRLGALAVVLLLLTVPGFSQESTTDDPALYAIGAIGASNLYFSYVVLGTVADGFVSQGYSPELVQALAEETIALNQTSIEALAPVSGDSGISAADRQVVQRIIEAHSTLILQAESLLDYINDDASASEYQRHRRTAWEQISSILALE
jgi:hypothetical protein